MAEKSKNIKNDSDLDICTDKVDQMLMDISFSQREIFR